MMIFIIIIIIIIIYYYYYYYARGGYQKGPTKLKATTTKNRGIKMSKLFCIAAKELCFYNVFSLFYLN